MSSRALFAMIIALAVLFAPAFAGAGEAFAAVPDHHAQMMESGHCDSSAPSHAGEDEDSSSGGAAGEKTCCVSMCLGVATAPAAHADKVALHGPAGSFALCNQYRGRIAEIATPPPKFA